MQILNYYEIIIINKINEVQSLDENGDCLYTIIVNLAVPAFLCEDKLSFHLTFSQNFVYILCLLQTDERQLINQALAQFYLFFFPGHLFIKMHLA